MGILAKHDIVHGVTPQKLVAIFVDLGPTFVKVGQLLSMRTDILPVEYCKELSALRTNINPLSFEEIKAVLESEYKKDIDEVFTYFDHSPIGAASIAQVHFAKIGDRDVVVKVQRPGIYDTMSSDIKLIKKGVGIIDAANIIGDEIDLGKVLDEMWTVTKKEMDFHHEAGCLQQFRKNNAGIKYVSSPGVIEEYSTQKILVMDYVSGIYIDDIASLEDAGYNTKEIALKLANNYVKQVIDDGFFHADPHAGNIKIDSGKIAWLDLGMMGQLSVWEKTLLGEMVKGFDDKNTARMADAVLNIGTPTGDIDISVLTRDLEMAVAKYAMGDIAAIDMKDLTDDFFAIIRRNHIAIPESLSILGRGMSSIQGVLLLLDSKISFAEVMANYVANDAIRNLNLNDELKKVVKGGYYSAKKLLSLPAQLSDALRILDKGLTKVNLELGLGEKMKADLDAMINRTVMGTIIAALLIGSSLICTTDMRPKMFNIPAIGFIGFVTAVILMIKLLFFDKRKGK